MDDPLITARHAAPEYCQTGLKHFCDAAGLDYRTLVTTGYPASQLLALGDQRCTEFVERFLKEAHDGQQ